MRASVARRSERFLVAAPERSERQAAKSTAQAGTAAAPANREHARASATTSSTGLRTPPWIRGSRRCPCASSARRRRVQKLLQIRRKPRKPSETTLRRIRPGNQRLASTGEPATLSGMRTRALCAILPLVTAASPARACRGRPNRITIQLLATTRHSGWQSKDSVSLRASTSQDSSLCDPRRRVELRGMAQRIREEISAGFAKGQRASSYARPCSTP
jgi:hypothetical protein